MSPGYLHCQSACPGCQSHLLACCQRPSRGLANWLTGRCPPVNHVDVNMSYMTGTAFQWGRLAQRQKERKKQMPVSCTRECLTPAEAGTHLPTPEGWKAELALGGWLVTYWNRCPATGIDQSQRANHYARPPANGTMSFWILKFSQMVCCNTWMYS